MRGESGYCRAGIFLRSWRWKESRYAIPLLVRPGRNKSGIAYLRFSPTPDVQFQDAIAIFISIMAIPPAEEDYVLVQSNLLDRMRQHCENCPTFNIPLQHGDNGAVTTGPPRNSRKRKASQSLGSSQHASKNDTVPTNHSEVEIRLRQCWPSSDKGLSQQSALETPRSGSSETSA